MKNYKYGKLVNGRIQYSPNPLIIDNKIFWNGSQELYESQGYKRILEPIFDLYDEETEYLKEVAEELPTGIRIHYTAILKPRQ